MSTDKKISFGFSMAKKKPVFGKRPVEKKPEVEYITTFEHRDIVEGEVKKEITIPVKEADGIAERIKAARSKRENADVHEVQAIAYEAPTRERVVNLIPLADSAVVDGAEETADYGNVPVADFGLAMLRGMGWAPGKGIGKKQKVVEYRQLELRPRGLGLGAGPDALKGKEKDEEASNRKEKDEEASNRKEKKEKTDKKSSK